VTTTNDLKHGRRVIFREYGVDLDILGPILVSAPAGICTLKRLGQYRGWGGGSDGQRNAGLAK
jgi:hypothetical protein